MTFHVYRAYDVSGHLLYVGQTNDAEARMRWHSRQSLHSWWPDTARVTFAEHLSRVEARAAEVKAIQSEHPRWNITHRSLDHPDGPARAAWEVRELRSA